MVPAPQTWAPTLLQVFAHLYGYGLSDNVKVVRMPAHVLSYCRRCVSRFTKPVCKALKLAACVLFLHVDLVTAVFSAKALPVTAVFSAEALPGNRKQQSCRWFSMHEPMCMHLDFVHEPRLLLSFSRQGFLLRKQQWQHKHLYTIFAASMCALSAVGHN